MAYISVMVGYLNINKRYVMNFKLTQLICLLCIGLSADAQLFDYDDSARRVSVNGTGSGDTQTTIINDLGYWRFNDAVGSTNVGSNQTAMQISSLAPNSICSKLFTYNSIEGSYPSSGDAEASIMASFTLTEDTRFKVDFFGGIHADTYQGYLFIKPSLFLNAGLNGNDGLVLRIAGGGVAYVDLTAGDYRLGTAMGSFYNCANDPDCIASIAGHSNLSFIPVDSMQVPGESFDSPFIPDSYSETESPDHTSITPEGAVIIRGDNSFYTYLDEVEGWFDVGGEDQTLIDMQSAGIMTSLQFPGNRLGTFELSVGDVVLGEFSADDVITFADYSVELGGLLLTGSGGAEGVKGIEINYASVASENYIGTCGEKTNAAVKLTFDEALVSFDVVMPFTPTPDEIFKSGFEG